MSSPHQIELKERVRESTDPHQVIQNHFWLVFALAGLGGLALGYMLAVRATRA